LVTLALPNVVASILVAEYLTQASFAIEVKERAGAAHLELGPSEVVMLSVKNLC